MHSYKNGCLNIGNGPDILNKPGLLKVWWWACRPKTLGVSLAPICMAGVLCAQHLKYLEFFLTLLCGVGLQILANWVNDWQDALKGVDTNERQGPTRMVQSGFITPMAMGQAVVVLSALLVLIGGYLVFLGGGSVLLLGAFSLGLAWAYSYGKKPLSFLGLGELLAFLFFGPIPVLGVLLIQKSEFLWEAKWGFGCGFLAMLLMGINNIRDISQDIKANKRTLAVRLGYSKMIFFLWVTAVIGFLVLTGFLYFYMKPGFLILWIFGILFFLKPVFNSSTQWDLLLKQVGIICYFYTVLCLLYLAAPFYYG